MFGFGSKAKLRRKQVREKRAQTLGQSRTPILKLVLSWPLLVSVLFIVLTALIGLLGQARVPYYVGQQIRESIYARVDFQMADPARSAANRQAARASTPSHYTRNAAAVTHDRIRAELLRLYQAAADAETYEQYVETLKSLNWPADEAGYKRLRRLIETSGSTSEQQYQRWVSELPLESEYIVRNLLSEPRKPKSTTDHIMIDTKAKDGKTSTVKIALSSLVRQSNARALQGSAMSMSRFFPVELRETVEAIVMVTFRDQPTLLYNAKRTVEAMRRAEEQTPEAMATFERGQPYISIPVYGEALQLDGQHIALIEAEQSAYDKFLSEDIGGQSAHADELALQRELRQKTVLAKIGKILLIAILSAGLLVYVRTHQPRIFEVRPRMIAFAILSLGTLFACRMIALNWPGIPELLLGPCVLAGSILAIVYPLRFAAGSASMISILIVASVGGDVAILLTLLVGVAVAVFQLNEIRTRTKILTSGLIAAIAAAATSMATGLVESQTNGTVVDHALLAAGSVLLAAFVFSGALPYVERIFRIATSLTLLEWRDPTRKLLQLLAREAPGTYNHSLVLGTLAEAACERIGADGLLAQVGALYHDIGKIPKAEYFAENQEGQINRHDNLAPSMSLLIILGHVKDGVEMAKEYRLPRVLHQFIAEHHGTTVVRYFHHVASEQQPKIASGKHDREVPEAGFRYGGPKPRTKESAVLMVCDGVESAVRAISDPTPSRIEGVVHQILTDRLNDGQFDDCDITLKQLSQVEDSIVKGLCAIYHGRVAYPKAKKESEESQGRVTTDPQAPSHGQSQPQPQRLSG